MDKDFIKLLNVEVLNDELSLDDIKGGTLSLSGSGLCCKENAGCNVNGTCAENDSSACCGSNVDCNID